MTTSDDTLLNTLLSDPILKYAPPHDMARMLINVEHRSIKEGELLFKQHEAANKVFLIEKGEFAFVQKDSKERIENSELTLKTGNYIGQEVILGSDVYRESAVAVKTSEVIALPASDLCQMAETKGYVKRKFFESYADRYHKPWNTVQPEPDEPSKPEPFPLKEILGWSVTFACPLLIYYFAPSSNLNAVYYMAIIAAAVSMWVFNLVPAYIPPLLTVLVTILLDVAPPEVVVSGFSSGSFFMLLSVFMIGAVMVASGLTYRLSLLILRFVPPTPFWYNVSLFFSGLLLTPVVPSQGGRTAIVSPFLVDITKASAPGKKDMLASQFLASTYNGIGLMASIFLTGKPSNLIVFGLFTYQVQFTFQWLHWLFAASVVGVVILILFFLLSWLFFKKNRPFSISQDTISVQLKILGSMSVPEWGSLAAIGVLIIGILTTSLHKIEIPWIAMAILLTLLLLGIAGRDELRTRIDWITLLFICAIISWVPIMSLTGIDKLIADNLSWIGGYMKTDMPKFVGLLCIAVVLTRLILPEVITTITFVTAMFPLAEVAGISPWPIGFIILTMGESFVFPYQMTYYLQLRENLDYQGLGNIYDEKLIIIFNIIMIVVRIIAIYASLPFWRYLNII